MYVIECVCGRRTETAETDLTCGGCGKSLSIQGWGQWPTPEWRGNSAPLSIGEVRKIIHNATNPVGQGSTDSERDNGGVTPAVAGD